MTSADSAQQTIDAVRRVVEHGEVQVTDDVAVLVVKVTD